MKKLRTLIILLNISVLLIGYLYFQRMPMASLFGEIFFNIAHDIADEKTDYLPKAIEFAALAAKYSPSNYRAHFVLGHAYLVKEKYAEAKNEFTICTQLSPDNENAHLWLGYSFSKLGDYKIALIEYNKAIELAPDNVDTYKTLAKIYKEMGMKTDAFAAYFQATSLTKNAEEKLSLLTKASDLSTEIADQLDIQPGPALGFGRQTSMVIDKQGIYHLLARVNSANLIIYAKSLDFGKTWGSKRVVYIGSDFDGSLAIGQDGVIHAIFGDKKGIAVYTNSTFEFSKFILVSKNADSKQIAIDKQGIVHLLWSDSEYNLWYSTINKEQNISAPTLIAENGLFPALALNGSNIYITYNLAVSYPDETGGVYFVEKTEAQWLPTIRLSESGKWAGASVITVDGQGNPHIVYYLADTPTPILQYATRKNMNWKYFKLNDKYAPFIPSSLDITFGGRTSPTLESSGNRLYFAWRSNAEGSPIILRNLDLSKNQFSEELEIGKLGEEPFDSAPSVIKSLLTSGVPSMLWSYDSMPVIYSVK